MALHGEPPLRELDHGRWTGHRWNQIAAYDRGAYAPFSVEPRLISVLHSVVLAAV
jgi:broad specificity phosphatase PhoE